MSWFITAIISLLLLPPTVLILSGGVGMLLLNRRPRLARGLIVVALAGLTALSMPIVANSLIARFEQFPPINLRHPQHADAIVILGAGTYFNAPEYGSDTVNDYALTRLRYGARLYRATHLPIAVSGGSPDGGVAEAVLMQGALMQDFGVPVRWVESRSDNTHENAVNSRALLPRTVHRIYLVTQAWHLPRAVYAFRRAGFSVIPAGTGYSLTRAPRLLDFVPQPQALVKSFFAFHEAIGLIWYRLNN